MPAQYVHGKVKAATAQMDRRAFLALGGAALAAGIVLKAKQAHAMKVNLEGDAAIEGYDAVAYQAQNAAVKGSDEFTATYQGATYKFASAANRDTFSADPGRYAPKYGGFCAYAVANNYTAPIDPQAFSVVDGALYLNFNKSVRSRWSSDIPGNIEKGDANWPALSQG
ncbi:MAG: YHS domain-containing (seleno)protein [Pseudomonadota bacterium]